MNDRIPTVALGKFRQTENLHILLWLIKDTCWVQGLKTLGLVMIAPTIGVAVWLTIKSYVHKSGREEFIHNLAICMWLVANSIWMIGEFFFYDSTRPYALIFFIAGLLTLAFHYIPKWTSLVKGKS
jgi:hypothetical protein